MAENGEKRSVSFDLPAELVERLERVYHTARAQGVREPKQDMIARLLEPGLRRLERQQADQAQSAG